MKLNKPISAGEILKDYIGDQSIKDLAEELGVSRVGLSKIVNGHTQITPSMAVKLSKKYLTDPMYWLGLSNEYEVWKILNEEKNSTTP